MVVSLPKIANCMYEMISCTKKEVQNLKLQIVFISIFHLHQYQIRVLAVKPNIQKYEAFLCTKNSINQLVQD